MLDDILRPGALAEIKRSGDLSPVLSDRGDVYDVQFAKLVDDDREQSLPPLPERSTTFSSMSSLTPLDRLVAQIPKPLEDSDCEDF